MPNNLLTYFLPTYFLHLTYPKSNIVDTNGSSLYGRIVIIVGPIGAHNVEFCGLIYLFDCVHISLVSALLMMSPQKSLTDHLLGHRTKCLLIFDWDLPQGGFQKDKRPLSNNPFPVGSLTRESGGNEHLALTCMESLTHWPCLSWMLAPVGPNRSFLSGKAL